MNVLAIGNSFSQDATAYLHGVARADKCDLTVVNLFIGGCSLERHFRNFYSDGRAYSMEFNGVGTGFSVSIKEALLSRSWDVVTLQQVSHMSAHPETYTPYIERLASEIRHLAPKAKLVLHQTWAYEEGSDRLYNTAHFHSSSEMLSGIKAAYRGAAHAIGADGIIPSGEMMLTLSEAGLGPVHCDTFHAALGIGRYALALLWYRSLVGADVTDNGFCDTKAEICKESFAKIKEIVSGFAPLF